MMEFNLKAGMKHTSRITVEEKDTAAAFGSGDIFVFSTPMMVGLMENAAMKAVGSHLPEGYQTVGIHLDIKHLAATPVGMEAWAEAELIEIDGKRLIFKVTAFDAVEKIGEGMHSRFIIKTDKFLEATDKKAKR
jgi:predicted thioesterase